MVPNSSRSYITMIQSAPTSTPMHIMSGGTGSNRFVSNGRCVIMFFTSFTSIKKAYHDVLGPQRSRPAAERFRDRLCHFRNTPCGQFRADRPIARDWCVRNKRRSAGGNFSTEPFGAVVLPQEGLQV